MDATIEVAARQRVESALSRLESALSDFIEQPVKAKLPAPQFVADAASALSALGLKSAGNFIVQRANELRQAVDDDEQAGVWKARALRSLVESVRINEALRLKDNVGGEDGIDDPPEAYAGGFAKVQALLLRLSKRSEFSAYVTELKEAAGIAQGLSLGVSRILREHRQIEAASIAAASLRSEEKSKARKKRRRGGPSADLSRKFLQKLWNNWQVAKANGSTREDFADQKGLTVDELEAISGKLRAYRQRDKQKKASRRQKSRAH